MEKKPRYYTYFSIEFGKIDLLNEYSKINFSSPKSIVKHDVFIVRLITIFFVQCLENIFCDAYNFLEVREYKCTNQLTFYNIKCQSVCAISEIDFKNEYFLQSKSS